jgi:hypothetical protein
MKRGQVGGVETGAESEGENHRGRSQNLQHCSLILYRCYFFTSFRFGPFRNTKKAILRTTEFREMTTLFRVIRKFISSLFRRTRL